MVSWCKCKCFTMILFRITEVACVHPISSRKHYNIYLFSPKMDLGHQPDALNLLISPTLCWCFEFQYYAQWDLVINALFLLVCLGDAHKRQKLCAFVISFLKLKIWVWIKRRLDKWTMKHVSNTWAKSDQFESRLQDLLVACWQAWETHWNFKDECYKYQIPSGVLRCVRSL